MTRIRSFKCIICDTINKDVKRRLDLMTLFYDKKKEYVYMCKKCWSEASKYYHMQKGKK